MYFSFIYYSSAIKIKLTNEIGNDHRISDMWKWRKMSDDLLIQRSPWLPFPSAAHRITIFRAERNIRDLIF